MEPITLFLGCNKSLPKEFLTWDPDTRKDTLRKEFGLSLSGQDQNMLEAMVTLKVTNVFKKSTYH